MKKKFYKSKTFYGALLIGAELALRGMAVEFGIPDNLLFGLGAFLTMFGFRDAMK